MNTILSLLLAATGVPAQEAPEPAPVYVIAQIEIHDRAKYREYEKGFGEIFAKYEGEGVGFSEDPTVVEGEWPYTRTVLLRFPSEEALFAWYHSPEYQELAENRWASSTANIVAIPGR
jgi:uncharacterized protein (DUF1330 family)